MADPKKQEKDDAPDAKAPETKAEAPKPTKATTITTEDTTSHVFRTDMGESLPPQKKPGVE